LYILKIRHSLKEILIEKKVLLSINKEHFIFAFKATFINSKRNFIFISNHLQEALLLKKNQLYQFDNYINKDDYQKLISSIIHCTPKNNHYEVEYRIKVEDNEKWILEHGHVIWGYNGNIKKVKGLFIDVTKNKISEKILQESEKRFQLLIEKAPVGIFISFDSLISYANPVFQEIFKCNDYSELIGSSFIDYVSLNDKDRIKEFLNNSHTKTKYDKKIESYGIKLDGTTFPFQAFITNIKIKNYNANITFITDITERKNYEFALQDAEERYRTLFDQSGLISNVYNMEETLIMLNSMAASIYGGTSLDFINKKIDEIHYSETARKIKKIIKKTIIRDSPVIEENELLFPKGKIWLKTIGHKLKDSNNKIIGIQLLSQDITEKKEIDRKLLNIIVETEEKERMHFAQELHDGLGPIISAIKMYVQWLSRPNSNILRDEILTDTEKLINEAGVTIRELSFKLSPHVLKNFGLIEAFKTFTHKVNQSKQIKFSFDYNFSTRFEETVETVIYRILCECINNTIKHAQATEVQIRILKFISKVKITYIDNGKGFDINKLSLDKAGNGLFNMKSRLQSINGELNIYSQPGEGVKISIIIKL
jgi:PAS domain S-box-containing protein